MHILCKLTNHVLRLIEQLDLAFESVHSIARPKKGRTGFFCRNLNSEAMVARFVSDGILQRRVASCGGMQVCTLVNELFGHALSDNNPSGNGLTSSNRAVQRPEHILGHRQYLLTDPLHTDLLCPGAARAKIEKAPTCGASSYAAWCHQRWHRQRCL